MPGLRPHPRKSKDESEAPGKMDVAGAGGIVNGADNVFSIWRAPKDEAPDNNRPLLLDLRTLSSHLDKVLLFSHMESPIRDVRKILGSNDVSEPLHRIDPQAFDGLLTPWLNRAARQTVETKVPGGSGTMRFFSKMRQRAGLAAMFAKVSNTAQQITGLSIAAVKVRPKYLLDAVAQSLIAPRQTVRTVASTYMATRMPATAIARPVGYIAGVSENKIEPTGAADAARGMVTGTPSPESKR